MTSFTAPELKENDMPETLLDPSRTALLVMDYQHMVLGSTPGSDELLANTRSAIETVREVGGRIGYVRLGLTDDDYDAIPQTNLALSAIGRNRFVHDEESGTDIHDHVAPEDEDIVVRKTRVGAFSTTDLDARLRGQGVDTIVLAGLHTSGVILSTVRDAADRDYRVVLLADCIADPDTEVHDLLMTKLLPRQAHVSESAGLRSLFPSA
jgi:nicotinamidase-related amidase